MRALLAAWLVLSSGSLGAATAIRSTALELPRPFGYVIGDVFDERFILDLNTPYRLETDALPHPGRLNLWLALRAVAVETEPLRGGTRYRLGLRFQIMSVPPAMARVYIPVHTLSVTDGGQPVSLTIPSRGVTVSPLVLPGDASRTGVLGLQPDRPPLPIPTTAGVWRLAGIGAGILVLCALLAVVYLILPLWLRTNAPFARACRALKRLGRQAPAERRLQAALRTVHEAINRTAGRVVLEKDLAEFVARFPRFRCMRGRLEDFFALSRAVFFGAGPGVGVDERHVEALSALCRRCRGLERARP